MKFLERFFIFSVDKNFLNENISSRVRGGRGEGKRENQKTYLGTLCIPCSPQNNPCKEERAMIEESRALTSEGVSLGTALAQGLDEAELIPMVDRAASMKGEKGTLSLFTVFKYCLHPM